jgi:arylsulfatase A-like enzyme
MADCLGQLLSLKRKVAMQVTWVKNRTRDSPSAREKGGIGVYAVKTRQNTPRLGQIRHASGRLLALAILTMLVPWARAAERAPNVVLVLADDLGWGDVGFNGRTEWTTPNLDRLASRGVVLKRCYTAAPICGPSRAALLTGKYTIHTGVRRNDQDLPAEEVTIAEALKSRGYQSAVLGKWQGGKPRAGRNSSVSPLDQGFDEFFGYSDALDAQDKFPVNLWQGRTRVSVSGYIDDLVTDHGIDFVNRHRDVPFFLYLAYVAPHFAVDAPPDEVQRHVGKLAELDPARPVNARYAAMITRLDRNIGRLVETLDRLQLSQNTLIFFTSDNGATFEFGNQGASAALDSNRPLRGQKRTLWEGGIRVPGLVCWPGRIPAGQVSEINVHLADLFPTFVSAAAGTVDQAWHVEGQNMLPVWTAQAPAPDRILYWEWQSEGANQLAALQGDFKLIKTGGSRPELYDVAADPSERRDLSAVYPKRAKQLQAQLDAWMGSEDPRGKE